MLSTEPMGPPLNKFSDRHGPGIKLETNGLIMSTDRDIYNAVAYTTLPIPFGRQYTMMVLKGGIIVSSY